MWRECALCGETNVLSLHHILKRPRDDLEANLVMVCGDGVRGCHGLLEAHDGPTLARLAHYLLNYRPDTLDHLIAIMGREAATDWLERKMT